MGNFSSQYLDEWSAAQKQDDATSNEKAELTPKGKNIRFLPTDPRSPTSAIRRTPIQVEKTPPKKKSYGPLLCPDENKLDFDECELGEEVCEETSLQETSENAAKTTGNVRSVKQRSPLKTISKKKIDSPGMYLRYKQMKGVRDGYSRQLQNRTVEMKDITCDNDDN